MNLLHLEYFYHVAKEGGYLRASEKLRIQQPAISRMVAQLEDYFGFQLLEKVGRNVQMTKEGLEVYQHCQKIFNEVEKLEITAKKISGIPGGPLLIAGSEPIVSHFLPSMISELLTKYPEIYPHLYSGPSGQMLKNIESGEVELGLFFHIPELRDRLEIIQQIDTDFRLVVKTSERKNKHVIHQFIGSREIDDFKVKKFPTLEKLKTHYPAAKIAISSNNLNAHRVMCLNGQGVSILPYFLIKSDLESKTLSEVLPGEKFTFKLKIVKRRYANLSLNAQKLLDIVGRN